MKKSVKKRESRFFEVSLFSTLFHAFLRFFQGRFKKMLIFNTSILDLDKFHAYFTLFYAFLIGQSPEKKAWLVFHAFSRFFTLFYTLIGKVNNQSFTYLPQTRNVWLILRSFQHCWWNCMCIFGSIRQGELYSRPTAVCRWIFWGRFEQKSGTVGRRRYANNDWKPKARCLTFPKQILRFCLLPKKVFKIDAVWSSTLPAF